MNKNVDPADVGLMLDETGLRLMFAREAIRNGRLPAGPADRLSQGANDGARCAVCGLALKTDEIGCKLEFVKNIRNWTSHYLHVQCFKAWELESRNAETAGSAQNGQGRDNDGSASGNGHDPGRGQGSA